MYTGTTGTEYPHWSYGTAGVIHFFAKLYTFTHDSSYLNLAVQGATHLKAIAVADTAAGGYQIPYSFPSDVVIKYYYAECHGNAGLIKSLLHLYAVTSDSTWLQMAESSARSLVSYTIPGYNFWKAQAASTYYWDNLSVCDGNMAAIEALQVLRIYDAAMQSFVDSAVSSYVDNALQRKVDTGTWAYWSEAEWRNQPNTMTTQVGMYIGAAGIAHNMMFLSKPQSRVPLPDYPFPPFY
eukprot:TRINITY_DN376_c0_g1_i4.p2 TRINITY_DN376_c0_g1~~TRINITY_DN376_c0_g1_i4.p2  ORF type:complete len:238 (+),score=80.50 TRINITY_DN376_c0_g1_i4:41-754(+)